MTDTEELLNLHPVDVLVCENCGFEIPFLANPDSHPYCAKCGRVWDKQNISSFQREQRVWVSQKGLEVLRERQTRLFSCNCIQYYRRVVRFRRALLDSCDEQGKMTEAQVLGMFISFCAGFDEGVLRLLGKNRESVKPRLQHSVPFYATLEKLEEDNKFGRNDPNKGFFLIF